MLGKTCTTQGRSPPNCHRSSSCESCMSISKAIIDRCFMYNVPVTLAMSIVLSSPVELCRLFIMEAQAEVLHLLSIPLKMYRPPDSNHTVADTLSSRRWQWKNYFSITICTLPPEMVTRGPRTRGKPMIETFPRSDLFIKKFRCSFLIGWYFWARLKINKYQNMDC